jgi:D-alanine--poly(phosphoribitol) ligase subunit 1
MSGLRTPIFIGAGRELRTIMTFLDKIKENFNRYKDRNAFFIGERFFTYGELDKVVRAIGNIIQSHVPGRQNQIGVITGDDLETYASILAIWFTRNIFVPLNPRNPVSRNLEIIKQAEIHTILTSGSYMDHPLKTRDTQIIGTKDPNLKSYLPVPDKGTHKDILYLLFTSGSTGIPKGVPISHENLDSFINAFISYGYKFTPDDRFLQIYDLSFDASFHCYTVPLVTGSCIFTVPQDEIKYLYALKLMKNHELTFVKMPPSTLAYLKPYFKSIRLEKLKYCLFGGEALDWTLVSSWSDCVPNTRIQNVYGPTEATINCLIYDWDKNRQDKQYNGIVSIGRPFGGNKALVADAHHNKIEQGQMGELYVGGSQITPGYWKNPAKNKKSFIEIEYNHKKGRFYRTGDLAIIDQDGDFLFCGRIDEQVQIDGFRVELGEIEHHARKFRKGGNVAVIAVPGKQQTMEIHLFIETISLKKDELKKYLESKLPVYMQPVKIHTIKEFPKSTGGKVNKKELERMLIA